MKEILGIEFGSTRIKSVLINESGEVICQGNFVWENVLVDGLWSYYLKDVWMGIRASFAELNKNYKARFGKPITKLDAIGISAMMHGYLALDKDDKLLAPFRTWRNTNTPVAAAELSELFKFNIPQRWSVAQYYQSVLDKLGHVKDIAFLTTLSGYVHYMLTGRKVLGIGDAAGMFPVEGKSYNKRMIVQFNRLLESHGLKIDFEKLLPEICLAGENAGYLTEKGAKLIDESGNLMSGCMMCPPEGDMGTGMIATDSILPGWASVSSGTSANMTVVLEKPLEKYYKEIDVVATPDGSPVALIHTNNCTNEINEWVNLFGEVLNLYDIKADKGELYTKLFETSKESDSSAGKLISYNFLSGEPLAETYKGFPMIGRAQDGKLNLANFMQTLIYSAVASLSLGMELLKKENVKVKAVIAHGGFYKTPVIGQYATAAVLDAPVTVMQNAGEGGAWGMALLALFSANGGGNLVEFLSDIFKNTKRTTLNIDEAERSKAGEFLERYKKYLPCEKSATEAE